MSQQWGDQFQGRPHLMGMLLMGAPAPGLRRHLQGPARPGCAPSELGEWQLASPPQLGVSH